MGKSVKQKKCICSPSLLNVHQVTCFRYTSLVHKVPFLPSVVWLWAFSPFLRFLSLLSFENLWFACFKVDGAKSFFLFYSSSPSLPLSVHSTRSTNTLINTELCPNPFLMKLDKLICIRNSERNEMDISLLAPLLF